MSGSSTFTAPAGTLGMMVVKQVPNAKEWGAVNVVHDTRGPFITDIRGDGGHMFCGVHITRPSVIRRLPEGASDSIGEGYLPWLRGGERVAAFEHTDGYFAEHSTPERYLESNRALLGGQRLRNPPGRLTGVDPTARIHPDATILDPVKIGAGAKIGAVTIGPNTVIGDGAVVEVALANTVVWPGAIVTRAPEGQIAT